MKNYKNRKAQITVFIIIGLVLLISASVVIYLTQIRKIDVIEEVVVPPEVQPVYDFVTGCLYQVGSDALSIIGTQGGYSNLDPARIDTRDITLTPPAYIKVDPANIFKLPHWFYEGELRVPTLEFMQKELADYVSANLAPCIQNFTSFEPAFEINPIAPPQLLSVITEDDVAVILEYPIEITQGGKTTEHDKFITRIPVKLKKIHELAEGILMEINKNNIFENITIDLMAMDPDVPMDPQGVEFQCGGQTWRLDNVEKKVQRLAYYNIPRFRVKGTDYAPFSAPESVYEELNQFTMKDINEGRFPSVPTPADAFEYNKMMIDPSIADVEDMKVTFQYQYRWGMDLNALPNDGGILRSNEGQGQGFLSLLCISAYHFVYDVIYPVQVRIRDPEAYSGLGYIFQFAFPVLIDDNQPNRQSFGIRNFQGYYIDTGFCDQPGGTPSEIKVIGIDEAGFPMTSGLRDVNISYRCVSRRCNLGQTGYNQNAPGRYSLITDMPPGCSNPIIGASKTGYLPAEKQLIGDILEIEMKKLRKIPFTISKHTYRESSEELALEGNEELTRGDQISIYMRLLGNIDHDQHIMVRFDDNETQDIELVEETSQYDIEVMFHNYDTLIGGFKGKNITISSSDFRNANEMVLHVFEYKPRPTSQDEERQTKMLTYYLEGDYKEELKPTFR